MNSGYVDARLTPQVAASFWVILQTLSMILRRKDPDRCGLCAVVDALNNHQDLHDPLDTGVGTASVENMVWRVSRGPSCLLYENGAAMTQKGTLAL